MRHYWNFKIAVWTFYVFQTSSTIPTSQSALPYRLFGQSEKTTCRCCRIAWFGKWTWLHYQASTDNVFCRTCCKVLIAKKVVISTGNWEPLFTVSGLSNWKDVTRAFKRHDDSKVHKHAVEKLYILPITMKDIGESLNVIHGKEKQMNREYHSLGKISGWKYS